MLPNPGMGTLIMYCLMTLRQVLLFMSTQMELFQSLMEVQRWGKVCIQKLLKWRLLPSISLSVLSSYQRQVQTRQLTVYIKIKKGSSIQLTRPPPIFTPKLPIWLLNTSEHSSYCLVAGYLMLSIVFGGLPTQHSFKQFLESWQATIFGSQPPYTMKIVL